MIDTEQQLMTSGGTCLCARQCVRAVMMAGMRSGVSTVGSEAKEAATCKAFGAAKSLWMVLTSSKVSSDPGSRD